MPKGKAHLPVTVVVRSHINELHYGVNASTMLRLRKKSLPPLDRRQIQKFRCAIREAFAFYQDCQNQECTLTTTEKTIMLKRIRTAATKLLKAVYSEDVVTIIKENMALRDIIPRKNPNILSALYKNFNTPLKDSLIFKNALDNYPIRTYPGEFLPLLQRITRMRLPPKESSGWINKHLHVLVFRIAPLWTEGTGRTVKPTSSDVFGNKKSHFALWVQKNCKILKLPVPTTGTIFDIIQRHGT